MIDSIDKDKDKAKKELEKNYAEAEKLLNDEDKLERFLQRVEKKLETVPYAGKILSGVPIMISLVNNYFKKRLSRYTYWIHHCSYQCFNILSFPC